MLYSFALAALFAPSTLAFPWLKPDGMDALLNHPVARQEIERRLQEHAAGRPAPEPVVHTPRQLGTGLVNGVTTLLGGTVEALVDSVLGLIPTDDAVEGHKRFPEGTFFCPGVMPCNSKLGEMIT